MTIQEMKERKKELGYTNRDIARLSGVPLSTVNKLFGGTTSSPRRETVLALESVLSDGSHSNPRFHFRAGSRVEPDTPVNYTGTSENAGTKVLEDPGTPYIAGSTARKEETDYPDDYTGSGALADAFIRSMYPNKKQGSYTLEDYLALPDDLRVELIDGVFYDLAAPRVNHQLIATQIVHQLMRHIEEKKGPCKPVFSPVDVQLDQDDKTVVQPDILILCRPETLIKNGRVFGAPDFIIEILSHSTRKKDMTLKLAKYSEAGVREYWMIDPDKLIVVVYDLEHEELPKLYNFTSKIPVLIWKEEFSVDFNAVYEYIKDYR